MAFQAKRLAYRLTDNKLAKFIIRNVTFVMFLYYLNETYTYMCFRVVFPNNFCFSNSLYVSCLVMVFVIRPHIPSLTCTCIVLEVSESFAKLQIDW